MKQFNLKSLSGWTSVLASHAVVDGKGEVLDVAGEVLAFEATDKGRSIKLSFNASEHVAVYASYSEDMDAPLLLAASDGLFKVEASTKNTLYVQIRGANDPFVFVSGTANDHRVSASSEEKYTNIETRSRRNTDFDRMMMVVKHNERERDLKMEKELRQMERRQARMEAREAEKLLEQENETKPPKGDDTTPIPPQTKPPKGEGPTKGDKPAEAKGDQTPKE